MTLETLLEELNSLSPAARSATVFIRVNEFDDEHVLSVAYEDGAVVIAADQEETDGD